MHMCSMTRRSILAAWLVQAVFLSEGWCQAFRSLRERIPKAKRKVYSAVSDGKDWKNPYLDVRTNGVELTATSIRPHLISIDSALEELEGLPDSAWPYGLVVAVSQPGLGFVGDDPSQIALNRDRLVDLLKKMGVAVMFYPPA
jgi:hypothetical protein